MSGRPPQAVTTFNARVYRAYIEVDLPVSDEDRERLIPKFEDFVVMGTSISNKKFGHIDRDYLEIFLIHKRDIIGWTN